MWSSFFITFLEASWNHVYLLTQSNSFCMPFQFLPGSYCNYSMTFVYRVVPVQRLSETYPVPIPIPVIQRHVSSTPTWPIRRIPFFLVCWFKTVRISTRWMLLIPTASLGTSKCKPTTTIFYNICIHNPLLYNFLNPKHNLYLISISCQNISHKKLTLVSYF